MDRTEALALLQQYNKEPFHIQHALTVEAVMGYFAEKLGYGDEKAFWETVGLLHDLDFEQYPEEHCIKEMAIMQELGYVGVMAMECFVTPQGLLINELAPRVHNSGHWTQNGASISQFELHLRAITDLPLPQPVVNNPSVMINLIGSDANYDWLKLPLVHLHWYDKEVRPGRKVGQLNLTDSDTSRLTATLEALIPLLPPEYASGVIWAQSKFG